MGTCTFESVKEMTRVPGKDISFCAYSPNGETLICSDGSTISVHQVMEGCYSEAVQIEGASSGCVLAMKSADTLVHSTPTKSTESLRHLDLYAGKYTRVYTGHSSPVYSISACALTGNTISCAENEVKMWDHRQKTPAALIPSRGHTLAKYTPGDGVVFTVLFEEKKEMKLFDSRLYSKGPYATKTLSIPGPWNGLLFSWDGCRAVVSTENALCIANGITGESMGSVETQETGAACFSADDEYFIYADRKNTISFCAQQSLKKVFSVDAPASVCSLVFNPVYAQMVVLSSYTALWQCSPCTKEERKDMSLDNVPSNK